MIRRALTLATAAFALAMLSRRFRRALADKLVVPGATMIGNCQMAWAQYFADGTPVVIMRGESHPAIPHAALVRQWGDGTVLQEFVPLTPHPKGALALLRTLVFRGTWRRRIVDATVRVVHTAKD